MMMNGDGTYPQLSTVFEEIDRLADVEDFPYLSHILGSDWGCSFGMAPKSPEQYIENAKVQARRLRRYPNDEGI